MRKQPNSFQYGHNPCIIPNTEVRFWSCPKQRSDYLLMGVIASSKVFAIGESKRGSGTERE